MSDPLIEELPLPCRLAHSYAPKSARAATLALLGLDWRLGRLMAGATEPMLAQLRLAWWRDILTQPVNSWPHGDPVLEAIANGFGDHAYTLAPLVDGWEELVADPPLSPDAIETFAAGRIKAWLALDSRVHGARGHSDARQEAIADNARVWALVDLAAGLSDVAERDVALALAESVPRPLVSLDRNLRSLRVLSALCARALARDTPDLLHGPASAFLAMRVGLFGR